MAIFDSIETCYVVGGKKCNINSQGTWKGFEYLVIAVVGQIVFVLLKVNNQFSHA